MTGAHPELVPSEAPDDRDRRYVEAALGRRPRAAYGIAVRGEAGEDGWRAPQVIENPPFFDDGTPMPTRYWLVAPDLARAVSRLESEGGVKQAAAAVPPDEVAAAHRRYASARDRDVPVGHGGPVPSGGVGGTRRGLKCLHAHYAWYLAGGDDPVGRWVQARLDEVAAPAVPVAR